MDFENHVQHKVKKTIHPTEKFQPIINFKERDEQNQLCFIFEQSNVYSILNSKRLLKKENQVLSEVCFR
jgi:hypothetical protein